MGIISGLRDMIIKRFLLIVAAAVSVFVVVIILAAAAAAAGNGISQHTCYICKTVYLPHTHTHTLNLHIKTFLDVL